MNPAGHDEGGVGGGADWQAPPWRVRPTSVQVADLPVLWSGDVVVVGGGSAGCAAAVAAGRAGARVLLVEATGHLGGTSVAVLDTAYGFFAPGGGADDRVVGGIGWEVCERLLGTGAAFLRPNTYGAGTGVTYEPESLKLAWDEAVLGSGAALLLQVWTSAAVVDGGALRGVVVETRRGPALVTASVVVDASGDGELAWRAGAAVTMPAADRRVQPLTATFRMGNVVDPAPTAELHRLMRAAAASGDYRLPRLEGSAHRTVLPGVFHTNLTRVVGVDATEPWELSAAEVAGRRQVDEYVRFLREQVPGYADAYLLSSSTRIGVRESRRLVGRHVLTRDDVLSAREFDDAVARCGAPVEDHDSGDATRWEYVGTSAHQPAADGGEVAASTPTGLTYGVPYRTLLPLELEGLLVAGRCLSATHDAHASVRSIAQCTATGQAAGTAAALAVRGGVTPAELDPAVLRAELRTQGAVL